MQKILVVEDDRELNEAVCYALDQEGYTAIPVFSIQAAEKAYQKESVNLILLDVNLPDGEGYSFCSWVKHQKNQPVLFLTARDLEEDILKGYDLGAEDYVTKPFSIKILVKRVGVILNRPMAEGSPVLDDGYLRIDFDHAKVSINGGECTVTPTEFRLLQQLLLHKGQLLTYDVLLERLWDNGGQFVDKHTLAVNVNRLRGKIEDGQHKYISNIYGMGYQWLG